MESRKFFRSAFRGFHRQDVLSYIDELRAEQQQELEDMQAHLKRAQEQHSTQTTVDAEAAAELARLQEEIARMRAQCDDEAVQTERLQAQNAALTGQVEQLQEEVTRLREQGAREAEQSEQLQVQNTALTGQVEQLSREQAEHEALRAQAAHYEQEIGQLRDQLEESNRTLAAMWEEQRQLQQCAAAAQDFSADVQQLSRELCERIQACACQHFGGEAADSRPVLTEPQPAQEAPAAEGFAPAQDVSEKPHTGMEQWLF